MNDFRTIVLPQSYDIPVQARDLHFMHMALEQAKMGAAMGEVPVGAVLVGGAGEVRMPGVTAARFFY